MAHMIPLWSHYCPTMNHHHYPIILPLLSHQYPIINPLYHWILPSVAIWRVWPPCAAGFCPNPTCWGRLGEAETPGSGGNDTMLDHGRVPQGRCCTWSTLWFSGDQAFQQLRVISRGRRCTWSTLWFSCDQAFQQLRVISRGKRWTHWTWWYPIFRQTRTNY
jgi:hypothetical protein